MRDFANKRSIYKNIDASIIVSSYELVFTFGFCVNREMYWFLSHLVFFLLWAYKLADKSTLLQYDKFLITYLRPK